MTALCGWLPAQRPGRGEAAARMAAALQVQPGQRLGRWQVDGLEVALLELEEPEPVESAYRPAVSPDGRHWLWMAGEAFRGAGQVPEVDAVRSRGHAFRMALLEALLAHGIDILADLDGEFHVVLWDRVAGRLVLANDRFGGLPLYWSSPPDGFAFASGVRGVLAAPGVSAEPDLEALREATSFGGFRLGSRTNLAAVSMLRGGSLLSLAEGRVEPRRYWRWRDIPEQPERPIAELIDRAHGLWQDAVGRRLIGARRPGQTLSGGLDSRAILAEAVPRAPSWTAITYGLTGCDDARYAWQAALSVGGTWLFHPLYSGRDPDWLEARSARIQETDGLIDLTDLMHLESLPLQAGLIDVHLSGYIGDAVAGPTFNEVEGAAGVLARLPYYGGRLGLADERALARVEELLAELEGAPARFALFEHKLPQATNRWAAAWRPFLRVRKPFTDHAFFDFFQGLPPRVRGEGALYARWLRARYPHCFLRIPNQKTGLPVLAPNWRLQIERGRRFAWRQAQPMLARLGLPARPRVRMYSDDWTYWRQPSARRRITETILRPASIACEVFGRAAVAGVLEDWFERQAAPTQVVGALYVFEAYHRDLGPSRRAHTATEAGLPAAAR